MGGPELNWGILKNQLAKKHKVYLVTLPGFLNEDEIRNNNLESYTTFVNGLLIIIN